MVSSTNATAEIFWKAFRSMPKKEQNAIVERLLQDKEFMEDLMDSVIIKRREKELSRPLEKYLAERELNRIPGKIHRKI